MIDPNDFVDTDAVFEDDYDPEKVTMATFTIVHGDEVNHAELVFRDDGIHFLGRSTRAKWGVSLYEGYHYNGQDLPIRPEAARHVLETVSGTTNLEEYDWSAQNWAYFE